MRLIWHLTEIKNRLLSKNNSLFFVSILRPTVQIGHSVILPILVSARSDDSDHGGHQHRTLVNNPSNRADERIIAEAKRGFDKHGKACFLRIVQRDAHRVDKQSRRDQRGIPALPRQNTCNDHEHGKNDRLPNALASTLVTKIAKNAIASSQKVERYGGKRTDQKIMQAKNERRDQLKENDSPLRFSLERNPKITATIPIACPTA